MARNSSLLLSFMALHVDWTHLGASHWCLLVSVCWMLSSAGVWRLDWAGYWDDSRTCWHCCCGPCLLRAQRRLSGGCSQKCPWTPGPSAWLGFHNVVAEFWDRTSLAWAFQKAKNGSCQYFLDLGSDFPECNFCLIILVKAVTVSTKFPEYRR